MELGVEDREPLTVGGEQLGVGVRQPDDKALELQATQVVAAPGLRVGLAEVTSAKVVFEPVAA